MSSDLNGEPSFKRFHACPGPVDMFMRLYANEPHGFIYESLEHGERGRYSFIGSRPDIVFRTKDEQIYVSTPAGITRKKTDPVTALRDLVRSRRPALTDLPFSGGAVGYIGYDAIRFFENIPGRHPGDPGVPDLYFIFPSEILAFDHQEHTIDVIQYRPDARRIGSIADALAAASQTRPGSTTAKPIECSANVTKDQFCRMVERSKEYIYAGDIFQVVLSQRFEAAVDKDPLRVYQALRMTNPSPYMYFLKLDDLAVLGSSPETLVKLQDGIVFSRPIAGTRPRGRTLQEDFRLETELVRDEKELAEHVMLVDLARNDLGRVCSYGSIQVRDYLKVEKYSRVMHIVSNVTGTQAPGTNAFDIFAASFPAGTVSGAPKIRAMEIIDELEPCRRGIYAGAIGYFGFDGNMDLCIAIRTITMKNNRALIQAGAGIVADSIPEKEYQETINKMSALRMALETAL
jgi:anthranilate synthase component 1